MVLTPQDARQLLDSITRIERSIRGIQTTLSSVTQGVHRDFETLERDLDKMGKTGVEAIKSIGRQSDETVELMTSAWTDFGSRASAAIDQVKRKMDEIEHHPALKSVFGTKDNQGTGMLARVPQLVSGMQNTSAGLEGGGVWAFLGQIAMRGAGMNIQENVLGNRLAGTFQATSRSATTDIQGLGRALLDAQNEFGKSSQIVEGFGTTLKILADAGITEEKALQRMKGAAAGFGGTLAESLTGMDRLFGLSSGQSAQFATQMVQDMGMNLEEATRQMKDLGYAARGSGASVETFVGTMLQATSSIRMQAGDMGDLVKTYGLLHGAAQQLMPGASTESIAKTSLTGLAGLAQGMAGLSFVQQNQFARLMGLGGGSAFERIFRFERGASDPNSQGNFLTNFVNTIVTKVAAPHMGSGTPEQRTAHAFQFLALGPLTRELPRELLRTLAAAAGSGVGPSGTLGGPNMQAALEEARKFITSQADPMEKLLENLQKLMASLGQMLLTLVTGLVNVLASMGASIVAAISGDREGAGKILAAGVRQETDAIKASAQRVLGDTSTFGKTGKDFVVEGLGLHAPVVSKADAERFSKAKEAERATPVSQLNPRQKGVIDQLAGEPVTIDATNMHQTITTTVPISIKLRLPTSNAEPPAH